MEENYGGGQPNILWASFTMALLTLPVVIVSVEEAIKTIPREMREASLALGATKWPDYKESCYTWISIRDSDRYNSCSESWCRRSRTYLIYRGSLFSFRSAPFHERSVYVTRISYLYYVDTVVRCGRNSAYPVCYYTGLIASHIFAECSRGYTKIQNKKKSKIISIS